MDLSKATYIIIILKIITGLVDASDIYWELEKYEKEHPHNMEKMIKLDQKERSTEFPMRIKDFSVKDCGSDSDPLKVGMFEITPDMKISASVTLKRDLCIPGEQISMVTVAWMKIPLPFFPFNKQIPCMHGKFGSCNISNICEAKLHHPEKCPKELLDQGLHCSFPIPAGTYSVKDFPMPLPQLPIQIPAWLPHGQFQAQFSFYKDGNRIGCQHVTLSLN